MAKARIIVGYVEAVEKAVGVWEDEITERTYSATLVRPPARQLAENEKVLGDISVRNFLSIVADPYANKHYFAIKYATWQGTRWVVSDVEINRPRLTLRLGGIYNGPPAS